MKRTKNLNNLSEKFMENFRTKYPPIATGKTVIFELLNIRDDPYNAGTLVVPFSKKVPARDVIRDPYDKEYKEIAYITKIGPNDTAELGDVKFYGHNGGRIVLHGGRASDQDIYEYLLLSNYREDNKSRDTSKKPIYRLIDPLAKAKEDREARKKMFTALDHYRKLDDEGIRKLGLSMGYASQVEMDVLRDELEALATKNPEAFLKHAFDLLGERKAIVRQALEQNVIDWDPADSKFIWSDSKKPLAVIARGSGDDNISELVTWTMKNEQTEECYQEIVRQVTGKKGRKTKVA